MIYQPQGHIICRTNFPDLEVFFDPNKSLEVNAFFAALVVDNIFSSYSQVDKVKSKLASFSADV